MTFAIETQELGKRFGSNWALRDCTLQIPEGSVTALVGPNGAGKTTLLRLITREIEPHGGSVVVSGGLGVMSQFVGSVRDTSTVRDLLVAAASNPLSGSLK